MRQIILLALALVVIFVCRPVGELASFLVGVFIIQEFVLMFQIIAWAYCAVGMLSLWILILEVLGLWR